MIDEGMAADRRQKMAVNLDGCDHAPAPVGRIAEERALAAEAQRSVRLDRLKPRLAMAAGQTKPHLGPLSPGCRICTEGRWSCLFINGVCNCRCFYCPSPQNEIGGPTTNRVPFADAGDYADYVDRFDYRGVSISGGEPLLTPDRTLGFLQRVRRSDDRRVHLWLYTNGTRLTADLVGRLHDAGLDEIRFDLSAAAYDLSPVRLAAGRIPCVTVEIPAIPEDARTVADLLPAMREAGVDHLNLHQLRLTPHNQANLRQRGYTFLHGDGTTVLESELAALDIMLAAVEGDVDLPVNYCSFVYKHRFQRAAARRNSARFIVKPHESITENGYIRTLSLVGEPQRIAAQAQRLADGGAAGRLWALGQAGERLFFHATLWPMVDFTGVDLGIGYAEALLCPHITYRRAFTNVPLNPNRALVVERQPVCAELKPGDAQRRRFAERIFRSGPSAVDHPGAPADAFSAFEWIRPGLQAYR